MVPMAIANNYNANMQCPADVLNNDSTYISYTYTVIQPPLNYCSMPSIVRDI